MKYSILTVLALTLSASAIADETNKNDFGVNKHHSAKVTPVSTPGAAEATQTAKPVAASTKKTAEVDLGVTVAGGPQDNPSDDLKPAAASVRDQSAADNRSAANDKRQNKDRKKNNVSDFAAECVAKLNEIEQLASNPQTAAQAETKKKQEAACVAAKEVADKINGQEMISKDSFQTSDGQAICEKKAGYTLDWESCKRTAAVYNTVVVAATALEMQAEVRAQNSQSEIAAKAQQKALAGDVQGAGLQASKDNSATMKQIHTERAAAYGAAVAALSSQVATWVKSGEKACGKVQQWTECGQKVNLLARSVNDEMFANESARTFFIGALAKYTAEAVKAGITASKYKSSEEAVAKIQQQYEEDLQDVQFDECVINPTAKKCLGPGTRVAGESYSAGTGNFSIGGAGSNSFDLSEGSDNFGEFGEDANIESQQVAAINSPFADEVKEANDILDQAGAASAGSGGAAPGGGAGGGGGMGGGGSASLGNDTKTPDETPEEAEIKAKKGSAGYASAGGQGFTGVKSSSEDSNPFSSLFDQKGSSGGLEEDRSIASNDIDDKSSILFQKISRKYSEMHSSKRIQANNLELE